jgi:AcrR family transcriptional regulator
MPINDRQRDENEGRRRTIVDAAETVLAETGREDMTMADIAEAAQVSRSLLYVYFEDMDDIVLAVTHRGFRSMRQRFEAAVAEHDIGLLQMRGIGEAYVDFAREEPTHFHLVAQFESRVADPEDATGRMRKCLGEADRGLGAMAEAIRNGIEDGSMRADLDPLQTAMTLWGSTHGLIQLAANKGDGLKQQYDLSPQHLVEGGLDFLGVALASQAADGSSGSNASGQ